MNSIHIYIYNIYYYIHRQRLWMSYCRVNQGLIGTCLIATCKASQRIASFDLCGWACVRLFACFFYLPQIYSMLLWTNWICFSPRCWFACRCFRTAPCVYDRSQWVRSMSRLVGQLPMSRFVQRRRLLPIPVCRWVRGTDRWLSCVWCRRLMCVPPRWLPPSMLCDTRLPFLQ